MSDIVLRVVRVGKESDLSKIPPPGHEQYAAHEVSLPASGEGTYKLYLPPPEIFLHIGVDAPEISDFRLVAEWRLYKTPVGYFTGRLSEVVVMEVRCTDHVGQDSWQNVDMSKWSLTAQEFIYALAKKAWLMWSGKDRMPYLGPIDE